MRRMAAGRTSGSDPRLEPDTRATEVALRESLQVCNLYSMTRNVDAIRRLFKVDALRDRTGKPWPLA
jgi:hypothetical protein